MHSTIRNCLWVGVAVLTSVPASAFAVPRIAVVGLDAESGEDGRAAASATSVLREEVRGLAGHRPLDVDLTLGALLARHDCVRPTDACLRAVAYEVGADVIVTGSVVTADGDSAVVLRIHSDGEMAASTMMDLPLDAPAVRAWLTDELAPAAARPATLPSRTNVGLDAPSTLNDASATDWRQALGTSLLAGGAVTFASALALGAMIGQSDDISSIALGTAGLLGLGAGLVGSIMLITSSLVSNSDGDDVQVALDLTPTEGNVTARVAF